MSALVDNPVAQGLIEALGEKKELPKGVFAGTYTPNPAIGERVWFDGAYFHLATRWCITRGFCRSECVGPAAGYNALAKNLTTGDQAEGATNEKGAVRLSVRASKRDVILVTLVLGEDRMGRHVAIFYIHPLDGVIELDGHWHLEDEWEWRSALSQRFGE